MLLRALLGLVLVPVVAGCAPAGAPSSQGGAPLPLYPMSLVFVGPREAGEPIGALLPDGSIVTKHDGVVARLLPDRVVTRDGKPKLVVTPAGDVVLDPRAPPMRFDARGALVSGKGEAILGRRRGDAQLDGAGRRAAAHDQRALHPLHARGATYRGGPAHHPHGGRLEPADDLSYLRSAASGFPSSFSAFSK